jgi:hypothetical protein
MPGLFSFLPRYTESMKSLALHRFLLRFVLAGASVFAWVFLFQYFYLLSQNLSLAFAQVAFLYALSSILTALVTPYAARTLRLGTRRALTLALLFAAAAFVVLGATFEGFWGAPYTGAAIGLFAVFLGIYRALYWVPYEVEAASGAKSHSLTAEILVALAPLCAGIFIASVPAALVWLFYIGAIIIVLSVIPLLYAPDTHENFSWGYRQTFHELLSREHRRYVTQAILEGFSGAALLLFWPLAIFLLIGWSYPLLGIVLSFTFIVALLLRAPMRALLRRKELKDSRLLTTVLAATPWLFRLAIASPLGVVLVDSYFYTTTPRRMGVDPFTFEQFSDGGSLIDEYTALKEMGLSVGRIAMCFLGGFAAILISVPAAFVVVFCVAAATSVAISLKR